MRNQTIGLPYNCHVQWENHFQTTPHFRQKLLLAPQNGESPMRLVFLARCLPCTSCCRWMIYTPSYIICFGNCAKANDAMLLLCDCFHLPIYWLITLQVRITGNGTCSIFKRTSSFTKRTAANLCWFIYPS